MCLSVPARILEIENGRARVSVGGAVYTAGLDLIDDPKVGDYILLHSGYAIQKINQKLADETLLLIKEMQRESDEIH